jgi:hypothetical protein
MITAIDPARVINSGERAGKLIAAEEDAADLAPERRRKECDVEWSGVRDGPTGQC